MRLSISESFILGPFSCMIMLLCTIVGFAGNSTCDASILMHHAGGRYLGPENTLAGINLAFQNGAQGVEIDMRPTGGGESPVLVLMHDQTVDRTTDGTGLLTDLTIDQVKMLDAGVLRAGFIDEPVPTLTEALATIKSQGGRVLLDKKTSPFSMLAEAVVAAEYPMEDAFVWAQHDNQVEIYTSILPGVQIIYRAKGLTVADYTPSFLDSLKNRGVKGLSLLTDDLYTQEFVDRIHANGFFAFHLMKFGLSNHVKALSIGVDVIDTEWPNQYFEALQLIPEPTSVAIFTSVSILLMGLGRRSRGLEFQ